MHICVFVCGYMHLGAGTSRSQKRALEPLELELEQVVRHLVSVLGTEPASSGR